MKKKNFCKRKKVKGSDIKIKDTINFSHFLSDFIKYYEIIALIFIKSTSESVINVNPCKFGVKFFGLWEFSLLAGLCLRKD